MTYTDEDFVVSQMGDLHPAQLFKLDLAGELFMVEKIILHAFLIKYKPVDAPNSHSRYLPYVSSEKIYLLIPESVDHE